MTIHETINCYLDIVEAVENSNLDKHSGSEVSHSRYITRTSRQKKGGQVFTAVKESLSAVSHSHQIANHVDMNWIHSVANSGLANTLSHVPILAPISATTTLISCVINTWQTYNRRTACQALFAFIKISDPNFDIGQRNLMNENEEQFTGSELKSRFLTASDNELFQCVYWLGYKYNPPWQMEAKRIAVQSTSTAISVSVTVLGIIAFSCAGGPIGIAVAISVLAGLGIAMSVAKVINPSRKAIQSAGVFKEATQTGGKLSYLTADDIAKIRGTSSFFHKYITGLTIGDYFRYKIAKFLSNSRDLDSNNLCENLKFCNDLLIKSIANANKHLNRTDENAIAEYLATIEVNYTNRYGETKKYILLDLINDLVKRLIVVAMFEVIKSNCLTEGQWKDPVGLEKGSDKRTKAFTKIIVKNR